MQERKILVHHGIKGQKWGVRNGPPYPIEHPVMPKGTKLATVAGSHTYAGSKTSIHKSHKNLWTYTYNPKDDWDRKVYEGPFSIYLTCGRGKKYIAKHSLEVVRDLKMPNSAQRIQEFKDLYTDGQFKERVIKECKQIQQVMIAQKIGSEASRAVDLENLSSASDFNAAYEVFNHAMEFAEHFDSTKEYMKRMESKYDAMVDDNNQGKYNEAHDPVIIFRINDVMYERGNTPVKLLTGQEIVDNAEEVRNELAKKGKHIAF